jgi:hypothetical protein
MMTVKEMIKREAIIEASTIRINGEDIDFENYDIGFMKEKVDTALEEVSKYLIRQKKIKEKEAEKQAKSFIKNYLKGVYGK